MEMVLNVCQHAAALRETAASSSEGDRGIRKETGRGVRFALQGLRILNPLTPNDPYRGRTAPLSSKRCILYIYSTNIGTEYFKHGVYSPFFLFKMQFVS